MNAAATMHSADNGPVSYERTLAPYFDYVEYAPTTPPVSDGVEVVDDGSAARHPVVICGGGPTGLALALGLALKGVRSVVVEADTTVCSGSRAGAITRRTLEICGHLGILDRMMAKGFSWSKGITYLGTEEIFSFDAPVSRDDRLPPSISLQQNYVEQYLVDEIAKYPDLVEIRWGSSVTEVVAADDHVDLSVTTGNLTYSTSGEWLVASDGARSTARSALGLRLDGRRHDGRYVIIDLFADTEHLPTGRRCWFDPPSNPGSTLLMYKKPDGMVRLDFQLLPGEDADEAMQPERVFERVRNHLRLLDVPDDWTPVWMSLYRASALTLDSYRHGRVLFAGDAAHLIPIFGVRGMNSCLDDTHNLAWKLAAVQRGEVTGEHADRLLGSYSDERVYAARENIRFASRSADFMAPPGPGSRLMRDAVLDLASDNPWIRSLINPRQHSAIPLVESPLNLQSAGIEGGPVPGDLMPECALQLYAAGADAVETFLGDHVGGEFTAICFTEDGRLDQSVTPISAGDRRGRVDVVIVSSERPVGVDAAVLYDVNGTFAQRCAAQPGAVYLLRPDGHILGRWHDATAADLDQALTTVLGTDGEDVDHG